MTPHTFIAYILDRSGSMNPMQEAAIAGFNEFLCDQKSTIGEARLTLVQFDDQYEVANWDNLPLDEVVDLDATTYVPRGSTALLDAIGKTIDDTLERIGDLPKDQRPEQVIFAIFTDGLENSSTDYTWKDISKRIKERREKDGWEFLFLAAHQDAIATAAQMNIERSSCSPVRFAEAGITSSSHAFSRKIKAMREWEELKRKEGEGTSPGERPEDLDKPMEDIAREEDDKQEGKG